MPIVDVFLWRLRCSEMLIPKRLLELLGSRLAMLVRLGGDYPKFVFATGDPQVLPSECHPTWLGRQIRRCRCSLMDRTSYFQGRKRKEIDLWKEEKTHSPAVTAAGLSSTS